MTNKSQQARLHAETAQYIALRIADNRLLKDTDPLGWRLAYAHAHAADELDPTSDLVTWTHHTLHRTHDHNPRLELLALTQQQNDQP